MCLSNINKPLLYSSGFIFSTMIARVRKQEKADRYNIISKEPIKGGFIRTWLAQDNAMFILSPSSSGKQFEAYSNGTYVYKLLTKDEIPEGNYKIEEDEGVLYFDLIINETRTE